MKTIVVYSSKTGNTKAIAEAIAEDLDNVKLCSIEDAPDLADFDCIICGYWANKGMPDATAKNFLAGIENKKIILFGTLGAYPNSDHAQNLKKRAEEFVQNKNNKVLGSWLCMGKVDPKLLANMAEKYPSVHPMSEARKARIAEGNKHPNEDDFANAKKFVHDCLK